MQTLFPTYTYTHVRVSNLSPKHLFGQACKNGANDCHDGAHNDQGVIHHLFCAGYLFAKQLQMEHQGQDNANTKAGDTTKERHDAIERREDDGDDNKNDDGDDA